MGRRLRFIPEGGSLVEVTCRTIQGRFLLRPGRELNEIVVGVLARAARLYPVELMGVVYLSNHFHLLAWVEEARDLADFMGYLDSNLAREAGRLHRWREKFWSRRYDGILVSKEEEVQVARLKYLLSHGVKEGLLAHPQNWPGVHCVEALLTGQPLTGLWFNRTREYAARQRGEKLNRYTYAEEEALTLGKLPCWADLGDEEYRRRVADLIEQIEEEGVAMRREQGITLPSPKVCVKRICRQDPHAAPERPKRKPAPAVHALRKPVREELRQAYVWFLAAYREAAKKLRNGNRNARFPEGSFPPALPYVPSPSARAP